MADTRAPAFARAARPWEMRFDLGPLRVGHPNAGSGHEHLRPVSYRNDRESTRVICALYEVLKPVLVNPVLREVIGQRPLTDAHQLRGVLLHAAGVLNRAPDGFA